MAGGRPTKYEEEMHPRIAKAMCRLGATNAEVANLFGICAATLALWRMSDVNFDSAMRTKALTKQERQAASKNSPAKIARRRWKAKRLESDPSFKVENALRARLHSAIKGKSFKKGLISQLDYSAKELMQHIEARFLNGMNWDNYGTWHIDHIKPCALFDMEDDSQFKECWSLVNLQPLWASDNIKKGASYGGS